MNYINRLTRLTDSKNQTEIMPAPDPHAITTETYEDGSISVFADVFLIGNRCARLNRASVILRKLRTDDWPCWRCEGPVPLFRRADARYCCEGCRKRAARARQAAGQL